MGSDFFRSDSTSIESNHTQIRLCHDSYQSVHNQYCHLNHTTRVVLLLPLPEKENRGRIPLLAQSYKHSLPGINYRLTLFFTIHTHNCLTIGKILLLKTFNILKLFVSVFCGSARGCFYCFSFTKILKKNGYHLIR